MIKNNHSIKYSIYLLASILISLILVLSLLGSFLVIDLSALSCLLIFTLLVAVVQYIIFPCIYCLKVYRFRNRESNDRWYQTIELILIYFFFPFSVILVYFCEHLSDWFSYIFIKWFIWQIRLVTRFMRCLWVDYGSTEANKKEEHKMNINNQSSLRIEPTHATQQNTIQHVVQLTQT